MIQGRGMETKNGGWEPIVFGRYFVKMYEFSFILISRKSDEDEGVFLC